MTAGRSPARVALVAWATRNPLSQRVRGQCIFCGAGDPACPSHILQQCPGYQRSLRGAGRGAVRLPTLAEFPVGTTYAACLQRARQARAAEVVALQQQQAQLAQAQLAAEAAGSP